MWELRLKCGQLIAFQHRQCTCKIVQRIIEPSELYRGCWKFCMKANNVFQFFFQLLYLTCWFLKRYIYGIFFFSYKFNQYRSYILVMVDLHDLFSSLLFIGIMGFILKFWGWNGNRSIIRYEIHSTHKEKEKIPFICKTAIPVVIWWNMHSKFAFFQNLCLSRLKWYSRCPCPGTIWLWSSPLCPWSVLPSF